MKQFKGMKEIEQLKKDAIAQGWKVDFTEWDKGGDWFWLRDIDNRMLQVGVNCFGKFIVYAPTSDEPIATEKSENLDNKDWYKEILDLLYEPMEEIK